MMKGKSKKETSSSSSAAAVSTSFVTPQRKRTLREIVEVSESAEESPMKSVASPNRDDSIIGIEVHVFEYSGGDTDDDIFGFALSYSYPMYAVLQCICAYL